VSLADRCRLQLTRLAVRDPTLNVVEAAFPTELIEWVVLLRQAAERPIPTVGVDPRHAVRA